MRRKFAWISALMVAVLLLNVPAHAQTKNSDFNGDGVVNFDDFFLFAAVFGSKGSADLAKFDLSNNGVVDFSGSRSVPPFSNPPPRHQVTKLPAP